MNYYVCSNGDSTQKRKIKEFYSEVFLGYEAIGANNGEILRFGETATTRTVETLSLGMHQHPHMFINHAWSEKLITLFSITIILLVKFGASLVSVILQHHQ